MVRLSEAPARAQDPPALISEVRVHGNHTTPDADVLALAGLAPGEPADEARLRAAEQRLRDSGRFAGVELRRRFRSIDDPADILIMLIVDEHDAVSEEDLSPPGALARLGGAQMWMPILNFADGYGFTYGARVAFVAERSRISVPMSWGGERKVGVELDLPAEAGSHIRVGAALTRRVNPHFDTPDLRREVTADAERALFAWLRLGANARLSRVSFGSGTSGTFGPFGTFRSEDAWHRAAGARLTLDTRTDPSFPRNAVHVALAVERLAFGDRRSGIGNDGGAGRFSVDGRGYLGLLGSSVLAVRGAVVRASDPLPPSEQLLIGGSSSLRGYRAGHLAGDGLALLSTELRVPLTSPLSHGRFGVKAFVDAATAWDAGARLAGRRFDRGTGAGVYFGATAVQATVDVAWPEQGRPRVHVAMGVSF